jgi:hypothetical protein
MSNRRKLDMRKLAVVLDRARTGRRPVLNWKDARRRGYRVPEGARK